MALTVVIPVAGAGTRLRPHTHARPKSLIPVAGKPMLGHILDDLSRYDIDEIALVIDPIGGEKIKQYVTDRHDFQFRFAVQEEARGLGHAIWVTAEGYRELDGQLLIVLGDTIYEADFDAIIGRPDNWIGVREVEDPRRFGVIELKDGRIASMVEKPDNPPTNEAIVGIYCFEHARLLYEQLDRLVEGNITTQGEIQLTDALQGMIDGGAVMRPFEIEAWHDCGKPETLLATNRGLLGRDSGDAVDPPRFPGSLINPPVAIAPGVTIENSIVGPDVSIGEGAVIRNSIVRDSIVAAAAEIENANLSESIISESARFEGRRFQINLGDHSSIGID